MLLKSVLCAFYDAIAIAAAAFAAFGLPLPH